MEVLPINIEKLINNLPIISMNDDEEFQKIIVSSEFTEIFNFYKDNYLPDVLKSKSEIYQRISLYLTLTGQGEQFTEQTDQVLYRRPCPDIHAFLTDKFYMGYGNATLYPYWKNELEQIFKEGSPIRKVIFSGCIGSGKSTVARKAFIYVLYRILCLRYPRSVFNIDEDATIANVVIATTLKQVYEVNILPFVKLMETMPCFQRVMSVRSFENFDLTNPNMPIPFSLEKSTGTIYFPDNIILTSGSNAQHFTGMNCVNSFCFTETMKIYTNAGIITFASLMTRFNRGEKIYTYSIDSNGNKEKTLITDVKCTGYKKELIRIYYDDQRYIECTPEHPFVITNPKKNDEHIVYENEIPYKQAQYLTEDDEIASENNSFVYALIDNRPDSKNFNKPFYIGISSHDNSFGKIHSTKFQRPYTHFTKKSIRTCKNKIKNSIIKDILNKKLKPEVKIINQNITLEEAFAIEKTLIKKYGKIVDKNGILANISEGGEGIILITPDIINRKRKKLKETLRIKRENIRKKKEAEWKEITSDKYWNYALIAVCINHQRQCHLNRVNSKSEETKKKDAKRITEYNKSLEHRLLTAYYNSIKPKVSSEESRRKLAASQSANWKRKSEEEKTKDNISKSLGRAWNVLIRVENNIINEEIFNSHRSKGTRLASTEPVWKTIVEKVGSIELFLKLIKERYGKEFIYEN